jgi:hypothetical protein
MKYVFYQPWGGLGDNLQFASLPEMLTKAGHEFYLHKDNAYRNSEIYDLVWKDNPYVKGISDEAPNAGTCLDGKFRGYSPDVNFIRRWELAHGVDEPRESYYPNLHYTPKKIEELKGKTIICLSAITLTPEHYVKIGLIDEIEKIVKDDNPDDVISLAMNSSFPCYSYNQNTLQVENIYHHCDIISSCKRYITIYSGSAVLSSILKAESASPDIHVFIAPQTGDHRNVFIFENTNYYRLT